MLQYNHSNATQCVFFCFTFPEQCRKLAIFRQTNGDKTEMQYVKGNALLSLGSQDSFQTFP